MLDEKTLKLLIMAEIGELPEDLYYPNMPFSAAFGKQLIEQGKLSSYGKTTLSAHRYEVIRSIKYKPAPIVVLDSGEEPATKADIEKLENRVAKLEAVSSGEDYCEWWVYDTKNQLIATFYYKDVAEVNFPPPCTIRHVPKKKDTPELDG